MNKRIRKITALGLCTLLSTGLFTSNVYASTGTKNVKATYGDYGVSYNGNMVSTSLEPFSINGSIFVSLKDAGVITGNAVVWDSASKTVRITGSTSTVSDQEIAMKNLQIAQLQSQVTQLEAKIKQLEATATTNTSSSSSSSSSSNQSVSDVLKAIRKDYEDFEDIDWNIELTTKSSRADLTLEFSTKSSRAKYNKLTDSKIKRFLEDICEDVQDALDLKVEGEIVDATSKSDVTLIDFSYSTSGKLTYNKSTDLDSLADDLEDDYENKVPYLSTSSSNILSSKSLTVKDISISESSSGKITFYVDIDLSSTQQDAWNDAYDKSTTNDSKIKTFLKDIANEIIDAYDIGDDEITGYLVSGSTSNKMATYRDGKLSTDDL